ncbi:MAG: hypothetical protein V3U80_00380 [Flavobacteriaceae bacterium]
MAKIIYIIILTTLFSCSSTKENTASLKIYNHTQIRFQYPTNWESFESQNSGNFFTIAPSKQLMKFGKNNNYSAVYISFHIQNITVLIF